MVRTERLYRDAAERNRIIYEDFLRISFRLRRFLELGYAVPLKNRPN